MKLWRLRFAGVLVLCVLAGCDFISLESEIQTIDQVEAFTGASLPADAADIHYEVAGFQDTIVWLRFDAAPDKIQSYLDELGFEEPLVGDISYFQPDAPDNVEWWVAEDFAERPNFVGGSYSNNAANLHFQALIDQADPDVWQLYLVVFNT